MNEQFSRLAKIIGETNLEVLKQKSVCVVGLGGVGGSVVEALCRCGIGTIILVDFDIIEISNLNRQIIALYSTIGKKKTKVWRDRILDINPACHVIIEDLFYEEKVKNNIFQHKIDYVVDACDTVSSKKSLILSCLDKKIPFISCMGTGNKLDPSKLEITTLNKTAYDPLARILRKWAKDENITSSIPVLYSSETPIVTHERTPGSSSFVPNSAGLLISSHIIRTFLDQ